MVTPQHDFRVSIVRVPPDAPLDTSIDVTLEHNIGTDMLYVQQGETLHIPLTLTQVDQGILVQFDFEAPLVGQCVRCLDDIHDTVRVHSAEIFFEPEHHHKLLDEGDEDIEDKPLIEGDFVDLEPVIVDALVPQIPYQPLCDENCQGLCPHCGIKLSEAEPGHHHDIIDPRFAQLAALLEKDNDEPKRP